MFITLNSNCKEAVNVSECLRGCPCEVGKYDDQYRGFKGTFLGHFKTFFIANIPEWDGEWDANDSYKEITFDTENIAPDPWVCAKLGIPVSVALLDSTVKGILDYKLPNTENLWCTKEGIVVLVDGNLSLDTDYLISLEWIDIF